MTDSKTQNGVIVSWWSVGSGGKENEGGGGGRKQIEKIEEEEQFPDIWIIWEISKFFVAICFSRDSFATLRHVWKKRE